MRPALRHMVAKSTIIFRLRAMYEYSPPPPARRARPRIETGGAPAAPEDGSK